MKTIKTRRVNIAICWNGLRNMPPKEFNTIKELENTSKILEAFKGMIPTFVESILEGEKMNKDISLGVIKKDDVLKARNDYFVKSTKIEEEKGDEIIDVEFENDEFNTFFEQFAKWGKNWFQKIELFLEANNDINKGNKKVK